MPSRPTVGSGRSAVTGVREAQRALIALAERLPTEAEDFLVREAQTILDKSLQLVPHESGDLARSGEVVRPGGRVGVGVVRGLLPRDERGRFARNGITVRYGVGLAESYAIPVHESPSKHDPPSWRGKQVQFNSGGPKFLERPFRESAGTIFTRLAAHLRSKLVGM
jgi:hypothetical protein